MKRPRVVIAGTGSGVGKTTISTGLMSQMAGSTAVQGFKVGPDFIDPQFHCAATGRPPRNLDSFLMGKEMVRRAFMANSRGSQISIIEGVRGLYDGLTATGEEGSTAEIAKVLDAPVILVVNARSLAKSAAAVVMGFRDLDPEVRIAGVILNQVAGVRHREKAIEAVEKLAKVPVVGAVERCSEPLPERHLGLVTAAEHQDLKHTMSMMRDMVADIDPSHIEEIAASAPDIEEDDTPLFQEMEQDVTIAVARDKAFCFYYQENLEALEAAGARLVFYRPADGDPLPDADAYYLGGGYPEEHLESIAANRDFLDGLKGASLRGKPIYGECGGLMTLCSSIMHHGRGFAMAGVFPQRACMTISRQGLSYTIARGTKDDPFWPGETFRGHEFHYSRLEPMPSGPFSYEMLRGRGINGRQDGLRYRRTVGAYMHQHALANARFGSAIAEAARCG
jgi:cobyrinic acid a,c-diamide synthase